MARGGLLDFVISRLPGISCRDKVYLCKTFASEADLAALSKEDIEKLLNRPLAFFWNIDAIRRMAERDVKICRARSIHSVSWASADYPPLLREIYDPPVLLFYTGALPNPERPLLAVVGTRRPRAGTLMQTLEITRDLARNGIAAVSGLALGIDAMAHRGCLEGGAPTYAVLGSAVDEVYPSTNRALARRILETGGALLSEYPPGTGPRKWNFPARNRIISALARGVLVAEAPEKSGALITANFALDQGKDLWVTSLGAASAGAAKLVTDGAEIVYSAADVLREWKMEYTEKTINGKKYAHNGNAGPCEDGRAAAAALVSTIAGELDIEAGKTWQ
jgi:DNA processing protein